MTCGVTPFSCPGVTPRSMARGYRSAAQLLRSARLGNARGTNGRTNYQNKFDPTNQGLARCPKEPENTNRIETRSSTADSRGLSAPAEETGKKMTYGSLMRRSSLVRSTAPSQKAVKRLTDHSTARDGQAVDRIGRLFPPSLPRATEVSVWEVREGKALLGLAERSAASRSRNAVPSSVRLRTLRADRCDWGVGRSATQSPEPHLVSTTLSTTATSGGPNHEMAVW